MGSWFSNLHIRKNDAVTKENVAAYIRRIMAAQGFLPVATEGEADAAFAVFQYGGKGAGLCFGGKGNAESTPAGGVTENSSLATPINSAFNSSISETVKNSKD